MSFYQSQRKAEKMVSALCFLMRSGQAAGNSICNATAALCVYPQFHLIDALLSAWLLAG